MVVKKCPHASGPGSFTDVIPDKRSAIRNPPEEILLSLVPLFGVTYPPMVSQEIRRWSKITLRTLHIIAVAGVGGGIIFGLDQSQWLHYWWLSVITGFGLVLIDALANRVWLIQVRGLSVYIKLALLVCLWKFPAWDIALLLTIIVLSAVISHAPSKLRYYSPYHRKVIRSNLDTKG